MSPKAGSPKAPSNGGASASSLPVQSTTASLAHAAPSSCCQPPSSSQQLAMFAYHLSCISQTVGGFLDVKSLFNQALHISASWDVFMQHPLLSFAHSISQLLRCLKRKINLFFFLEGYKIILPPQQIVYEEVCY